jgi:hypothetical protein
MDRRGRDEHLQDRARRSGNRGLRHGISSFLQWSTTGPAARAGIHRPFPGCVSLQPESTRPASAHQSTASRSTWTLRVRLSHTSCHTPLGPPTSAFFPGIPLPSRLARVQHLRPWPRRPHPAAPKEVAMSPADGLGARGKPGTGRGLVAAGGSLGVRLAVTDKAA